MGGKSCLAVTFAPGSVLVPGLVNPGLTARDHIPLGFGFSFRVELGVIHPDHGNCGIPATLGADLP